MNDFGFPKQTRSQRVGRVGESYFEHFVTTILHWVYRPVHRESDFGIDGYIDVTSEESVTGRSLAVQIKCGDTYIAKRTAGGIKYEGSNRHLNYYMNQSVPIILIVLSSDCSEGYWVEFDVMRTNRSSTGWWIEIPKRNQLNIKVAQIWSEIAGPADDFSEGVQLMWTVDDFIQSTEYRSFAVPFEEVQHCSMAYIISLLHRLSKTQESLLANRGKLEIYFPGYDSDPREIYEVPEIRRWFAASLEVGIPWFYFLDTRDRGKSLRLLLLCTCSADMTEPQPNGRLIYISGEARHDWLMKNFHNLNIFAQIHEIPDEIVKERSLAVVECLDRGGQ
jgi:hypothetical protein